MKKLVLFILLLIPLNVFAKDVVTLDKCIDGDTASFSINGNVQKVRFIAINAPEYTSKIEQFGKEASEYTCNKLTNANLIELEYDPKSDLKDKYDRVLAWVYVDNSLLQKELVENGYAEVAYVYDDYLYINDLCSIQEKTYNNKIGIWSNDKRQIGYCKNHKSIFNDEFDYNFIINNLIYIIILILLFCLFIIIVVGVSHGSKRNRKSRSKTRS
jgi:micrococcal nuclease